MKKKKKKINGQWFVIFKENTGINEVLTQDVPWYVLPKLGGPVLRRTDQKNSKSTCSERTTEKHKPVPEG